MTSKRKAVGVRAAIEAARADAARTESERRMVGAAVAVRRNIAVASVIAIALTVTAAPFMAFGSADAPVVRRIVDPQHDDMRRFDDWREMAREKHALPESCWTLNQLEDRYEPDRKIPAKAKSEYRKALTGCYLASLPKA